MPILIYICEDSTSDTLRLKHHLETCSKENQYEFDIISFSSTESLLSDYRKLLHTHRQPELLFLDIYMDGMNGMDTARELRNMGYNGGIIFTTSSTQHAMDSYEVNALYYLQKPYTYSHFQNAMSRCSHILSNARQSFTYTIKKEKISITYQDIVYFETGYHTVILHSASGTVTFSGSLIQVVEELKQLDYFLPIGRSYCINLNHVAGRLQNDLIMSDNTIVQIPLRKQKEILSIVENWQQKNR